MRTKNKIYIKLTKLWINFNDNYISNENASYEYQRLMIKSWPIIYNEWLIKKDLINKEISKLLVTMSRIFSLCNNENLQDTSLNTYIRFHQDFMNSIVYKNDIDIDAIYTIINEFTKTHKNIKEINI